MHRQISYADSTFSSESPLPLYLFTALLAILLGLDLTPTVAALIGATPPWANDALGPRFALIAAVVGGARILYASLQDLLDGKLGADLALAIAALAAILMNEPLVAAEVVFIGMLGECLEAFTFSRTQNAIRKIVEVFPRRCWRLEGGAEVRVFTEQLAVGDRVVVKPGGKIPVDGVILSGESEVDVSALTGESVPAAKRVGDEVLAGSINQNGVLTIEALKVAQQTVAGRVIEMTAAALREKTSGERIADRMARLFLPMVLGLAAITLLAGFIYHTRLRTPALAAGPGLTASLYPTLAVLVVACPCALILATPAAVMAALARLAGTGILIKSGRAIERLAAVNALAVDKTGTVTEGKLSVRDVHPLADASADELLALAASAEQPSEHPLARAVVAEAAARRLSLEPTAGFHAHPGGGIVAQFSTGAVAIGNRRFLSERNVAWTTDAETLEQSLDVAGQTPLWIARDGRLLGAIGVQDRPRADAGAVLAELRGLGISPIVLLTGDRRSPADAIGADLGFTEIGAELLPHRKAERVEALKTPAVTVAMIGDGINDAPALAKADVGLAIGGVDLVAEAGDVLLLGDPLRHLPLLIRLSRQTVRVIRQNIIWFAFVVNVLGILLTAWLWPLLVPAGWAEQSPLAAVIYHQIGSLAVLLNSMRLLWFERTGSTATVRRLEGRLRDIDLWIDRTFDVHELTHVVFEHPRKSLGAVVTLVVIGWLASGLTIVAPEETGVVRRFGRSVATLEPGWSWRYPWPIESTTRVSDRVRTVEIGFRDAPGGVGAATWSSGHRRENRRPDEATMITGDGNLVDVQAVLRYRIAHPNIFLFEVADGEEILRASTEATLRNLAAARPFQELLTVDREALQSEALARLREACASHGSRGLGVELQGLSLVDLHPPAEVVDAYYGVAKAMEDRDRMANLAEERAVVKRKTAQAEADKIVADARAAATEQVLDASAQGRRFVDRSQARKSLGADQEMRLALDAIELALRGLGRDEIDRRVAQRRQTLLTDQAALSDFRLFWNTLGDALAGRDIVLVDSDNVRGQRNLFLVDPDLLRPAAPILIPGRAVPMRPQSAD